MCGWLCNDVAAISYQLHLGWIQGNFQIIMPLPQGGIKRYCDPSICLSHGAAALGAPLP